MSKDIEEELDAIFAQHNARVARARNEAMPRRNSLKLPQCAWPVSLRPPFSRWPAH